MHNVLRSVFIANRSFTFISNNCHSQLLFTFSCSNKRQHMVKNTFRFYPRPYQKMLQQIAVVSPHCLLQSIIIMSCKFPFGELSLLQTSVLPPILSNLFLHSLMIVGITFTAHYETLNFMQHTRMIERYVKDID